MLSFVKNWLGPKANPIGVDFGSDSLQLAQVGLVDKEWRLVAAASEDVPSHARHDPAARATFFNQAIRDLLAQGKFTGRQAILALPVASMFIQHLRLPKMDEEGTRKAIPWEARGKLPIDPSQAVIRHHIAGEVYQEQDAKQEVILMAAGRDTVNQFLGMATKAKLEVVGMNVEPQAIVDCFGHIYRRKTDAQITSLYVDLGCAGTRAVIAHGGHMLFARAIPIGSEHFDIAVASALKMGREDVKLMRLRMSNAQSAASEIQPKPEVAVETAEPATESFALLNAALSAASHQDDDAAKPQPIAAPAAPAMPIEIDTAPGATLSEAQVRAVEQACQEPLDRLVTELDLCRRYHEATFSAKPVDRLIFIGGQAKHRWLCQYIAREMGLAAQVGDPMVRMGRTCEIGLESGMDRRMPQPNWAVAIGLTLGPVGHAGQSVAAA